MEFKFLILAAMLAGAIIVIIASRSEAKYAKVVISDTEVRSEIADTPLKQMKGLMFRKSLPENEGMLFIFDEEDYYGFWMMNTSIPLDIIWINKDMEIVHIEKNVQPCGILCPIYKSKEKAIYILEVNAGFVKKHGIEVGHFVEI